jgi:DNA-binding MarR family transcriptional regulator
MVDFDTAAFVWHRLAARGEMPRKLLAEMGQALEISQFHSLTAVLRIQSGKGHCPAQPATIGLLAAEMNIDPSRASRIASDLITAGLLRREAAQDDGRKSVLALTDRAETIFSTFRDLRFDKVMQVFDGWTDAEIIQFSALFTRYTDRLREVFHDQPPT